MYSYEDGKLAVEEKSKVDKIIRGSWWIITEKERIQPLGTRNLITQGIIDA